MSEVAAKQENRTPRDISSFGLHIIAMLLMLCDHLWATVIPGQQWMTWIGRLAFPIFAFMIVEGYFHTKDFKKYLRRLLLFAIIAEIPFNLMYTASWIFPFMQNVMWTFLWSLLCIKVLDKIRHTMKWWFAVPVGTVLVMVFVLLAQLSMVDYQGYGVLMVVAFYLFRGHCWYHRLGQLISVAYINWELISGMNLPIDFFGFSLEIPQQGFAILALPIIWCYKGRQGFHNRYVQYGCYAFYPLHMLILGLLSM